MKKYAFIIFTLIIIFSGLVPAFSVFAFEKDVQSGTVLRSEFSTSYYTSSQGRKDNIALGASKINGYEIPSGGVFSFNEVVGPRTRKAGFKMSKIIKDGDFIDGVGGGVCQLSTTLYNAVLLSDLEIIEVHQHTLAVSYVRPAFDAMVSSICDFKFKNTTNSKIILKMTADEKTLTARIFGEPQNVKIERISIIIATLDPPAPLYIDEHNGEYPVGEDGQYILRKAVAGKECEGYITREILGITETKKIRHAVYRGLPAIIVISE